MRKPIFLLVLMLGQSYVPGGGPIEVLSHHWDTIPPGIDAPPGNLTPPLCLYFSGCSMVCITWYPWLCKLLQDCPHWITRRGWLLLNSNSNSNSSRCRCRGRCRCWSCTRFL